MIYRIPGKGFCTAPGPHSSPSDLKDADNVVNWLVLPRKDEVEIHAEFRGNLSESLFEGSGATVGYSFLYNRNEPILLLVNHSRTSSPGPIGPTKLFIPIERLMVETVCSLEDIKIS